MLRSFSTFLTRGLEARNQQTSSLASLPFFMACRESLKLRGMTPSACRTKQIREAVNAKREFSKDIGDALHAFLLHPDPIIMQNLSTKMNQLRGQYSTAQEASVKARAIFLTLKLKQPVDELMITAFDIYSLAYETVRRADVDAYDSHLVLIFAKIRRWVAADRRNILTGQRIKNELKQWQTRNISE